MTNTWGLTIYWKALSSAGSENALIISPSLYISFIYPYGSGAAMRQRDVAWSRLLSLYPLKECM